MTSKKQLAAPPLPRRPIVEKMCSSCPFGPDAGRPKINVSDRELEDFKETARRGEFYCHETVLEDLRTKKTASGDAVGIQPHFRVCRGGWELRLKYLRERHG